MPIRNKKLTVFFPDDWEDKDIEQFKDGLEQLTNTMTDVLTFEIEEIQCQEK